MKLSRYTAKLTYNGKVLMQSLGNDLQKLIIKTLFLLDNEKGSVSGVIFDNHTGEIVHRCRKAAME